MITKINDNNTQNQLNFIDMIMRKFEESQDKLEENDIKKNKVKKDLSVEEIIDIQSLNEIEKKNKELKDESVRRSRENFKITRKSNENNSKIKINEKVDYDFKEVHNEILKKNVNKFNLLK